MIFYQEPHATLHQGDAKEILEYLPPESVDMCVTSPPYYGLREYGMDGQIGLEKTPEEYVAKLVAIFREVRRVLKKEGTLWLNLGDSYSGSCGNGSVAQSVGQSKFTKFDSPSKKIDSLKPKDLIGIPWRVAFALQQPYYTGVIKNEADRIWLAAMIDGEGCMFIHKRKAGQNNGQGYERKHDTYGAGLEVANTHESIIKRCQEITGQGSICFQDKESQLKNRNQRLFRWNMRSNECRDIIREIYPYLVGKKHEARLLLGCPSSGEDADKSHQGLMNLHNGLTCSIDFPEPDSMYEPGYYLRQDIIWSKKNCMPESVTDRCTKSHEYIFLLSKAAHYYYDAEAIKEPAQDWGTRDRSQMRGGTLDPKLKHHGLEDGDFSESGRNKRSVWEITTQPYKKAHFATYPPALVEPCILAGCPIGGTVIDVFVGSGTTLAVAKTLNRKSIGIELNSSYCKLCVERLQEIPIPMELGV